MNNLCPHCKKSRTVEVFSHLLDGDGCDSGCCPNLLVIRQCPRCNHYDHPENFGPINLCYKCHKPLIPDTEAVKFGTDNWDGHTFKPSCDCIKNKDIRISIG